MAGTALVLIALENIAKVCRVLLRCWQRVRGIWGREKEGRKKLLIDSWGARTGLELRKFVVLGNLMRMAAGDSDTLVRIWKDRAARDHNGLRGSEC